MVSEHYRVIICIDSEIDCVTYIEDVTRERRYYDVTLG